MLIHRYLFGFSVLDGMVLMPFYIFYFYSTKKRDLRKQCFKGKGRGGFFVTGSTNNAHSFLEDIALAS